MKKIISVEEKKKLDRLAAVARALTVDAIEYAQSGHPGLPLGCAEFGALLFTKLLHHYPAEPNWINRDRFILSAGHGSMFLYAFLYLLGYGLTIEDLKRFRSWQSKTPGHPEYGVTPGVETTTGPLGQGFTNAVGMAIADQIMWQRVNRPNATILNNRIVVLASDGDLMEGVVAEAASLAGHLGLGNLIVFFDDNEVTIDGPVELTTSDDTKNRFLSLGWKITCVDGYDYQQISDSYFAARNDPTAPHLIIMRTIIGKNAPGFEGFNKAHSGPIGARAIAAVKRAGGLPEDLSFYVPEDVVRYLRHVQNDLKKAYSGWKHLVMEQPESSKKLVNNLYYAPTLDRETEKLIDDIEFQPGEMIASRQTGGVLLGKLLKSSKLYVAGAADLTSPCLQGLDAVDAFSKTARGGKLLFFGVREHAMAGICNGLALNGAIRATCATFLSFSDYLRPALRLSALMGLPVIYTFAYDSVWNGEDGPTHQPIEQIPGLRAIPGLLVIRPADAEEALEAWRIALGNESSPTAILVTRQKLRVLEKPTGWKQEFQNGAYVIQESSSEKTKLTIFASGSEVGTTVDACSNIDAKDIRIVSMPCRERFLNLPVERIRALIPTGSMIAIIEASRSSGWEALQKYGAIYVKSIDRFGGSAPGEVVAENLGVGPKALASWIESVLHVY